MYFDTVSNTDVNPKRISGLGVTFLPMLLTVVCTPDFVFTVPLPKSPAKLID